MSRYAIFTTSTGKILRVVDCPETMIEAQLVVGEAATPAGQDISDATHYVMGGFQQIPARPSPHHEWDWATKQWREPSDLGPARAAKWSQIKAARDAEENGGFDTSWGRFDSDPASQTKLIGAAQLASIALAQGAPFGIEWTLQDNTSVPLDANQMISVGVALAAHIDAAHQRGRQLRAQIEAATTLQDLESITWTP
jgi:hypothetical protein